MTDFGTFEEIPSELAAGDVVTLSLSAQSLAYPVDQFTLALSLKLAAAAAITVSFADVSGVQSGALDLTGAAAGTYLWTLRATAISGGASQIVGRGSLVVRPDGSTADDMRSHAEKMLVSIEALIEGRAQKDVNQYSIAGRSLTKMTIDELIRWRTHYRAEVRAMRAKSLPNGGRKLTYARFTNGA